MSSEMKAFSEESCTDLVASESPRLEVCTHLCLSDLKQIINLSVEETVSSTLSMLIESKMTPLRAEMSHLREEIDGVRDVVSDFNQMNSQLTDLEKCVDTLDSSLQAANCTAAAAPDIKRSLASKVENLIVQQLENNLQRRKWALVVSGLKSRSHGGEVQAQQIMLQFDDHVSTKEQPAVDWKEGNPICTRPALPQPPTEAPIYIPFQDLGRRNLRLVNTYLKEELNITATQTSHTMPVQGRSHKKEPLQNKPPLRAKLNSPAKKTVKGNEMLTPPPTLPPRKTEQPKPPARRKKEKKPPLPEKIHLDPDDNQFYEEMNQMTLESSSPAPPPKKNVLPPPPLSRCFQNTNICEDDGGRKSSPPLTLPPRKMPAIPSMTAHDSTRPQKKTMSHSAIKNRPRIEPPNEKPLEDPLSAFRWYHGDSERMVVEKKLLQYKMDGMFAVRNSKTKGPNYPYAVTLYHNGKTFNFPIRIRDSDKRFALGSEKKNEPSFESLNNLVEYFKTNKIKLMNNQSAILNIPLDRFS